MNRADVVVVGAGPAGAAAAIGCARAGLDVVLLDDPGRGRPGETLHPGVGVLLAEQGVDTAGFRRHAGHWVAWGGPARFEAFGADAGGPWLGYQAPREILDALLVDAAQRAGARVWRAARGLRPLACGDRVTGVTTSRGELRADVVIDAGGRRHWLARRLGVAVRRVSPPLIAAYGHTRGPLPRAEPLLRSDADGWTWVAPIAASTCAWVRLSFRGSHVAHVPVELADATPLGPTRGADVTWRCAPAAGPGWFLVGDAATVLDPASSHGVLRAVLSGMLAAHAVVECRAGRITADRAAAGFRRWSVDRFGHDVTRLNELYRAFPQWPGVQRPGVQGPSPTTLSEAPREGRPPS